MGCGSSALNSGGTLRNFYAIRDKFESVEEVTDALRQQGVESSNLIVGIDFTLSNKIQGQICFNGKCLHSFEKGIKNPYEQVISTIGQTLGPFDDDKLIPTYGFGDKTTMDSHVFSFNQQDQPIYRLENVVLRYRQIAPHITLHGPTSFAPLIRHAMDIVRISGNQYHILLIIADGYISMQCMTDTISAIVEASNYPLSIVMVGVGDGPWGVMESFDDLLPQRKFDNFQFVNFTEQMQRAKKLNYSEDSQQALFALHALMEIPEQYQLIKKLGLMENTMSEETTKNKYPPALEPPQEIQTS
eukprot:TRINITY_DN66232_c0_g2_i1.p1 TRINITY_DN66232_c0_g2~~TRINITY_DN66232_c0_g2_i1.p1  ORF type:complete len:322 (+),score=29.06 TRINITY_DN66232_c0_g2_i1:64-966(+)